MNNQRVTKNSLITPNVSSEGINMEIIKNNTRIAIERTAALQALYKAAYIMGINSKELPENSASNRASIMQYGRLPVLGKAKSDSLSGTRICCKSSMFYQKALTIADFNCCITANRGSLRSTADLTILSDQKQMNISHRYGPRGEHLDFDIVGLTQLLGLHWEENKCLG